MNVIGSVPAASGGAPGWAGEYQAILDAYRQAGGDPTVLRSLRAAAVVASGHTVLAANEAPGVRLQATGTHHSIHARVEVAPATQPPAPVHLCFGMLPATGRQHIDIELDVGDDARVRFLAHCSFPNARQVEHTMQARIHVGAGASMIYDEGHFHGPFGGVVVRPTANVRIDQGGRFTSSFRVVHGRVGQLELRFDVAVADAGMAELVTSAYGTDDDRLRVDERLHLTGRGARSLTRTRIAVRDDAISEVVTRTEGDAADARGHMDCTEIVRDRAVATNSPVVVVRHADAQVTHEAAIGRIDHRQLETLMARGLDEQDAVDVIIRGMLGDHGAIRPSGDPRSDTKQ
ncbi:MAG: SufB/SufD family protein [Actinomycetota bacterium]